MGKVMKSPLFKKYVGSYLVVFSIPFIIFLITINSVYISNLREELVSTQENVLQQTSLLLDEQIVEMNSIGNQINYSREFVPHTLSKTEDFGAYIEHLKMYESSARSIKEIYVILDSNPVIFSTRGTLSMPALLNNTSHFDVVEKEKLKKELIVPQEQLSVYTLDNLQEASDSNSKAVYYTMPLNGSYNAYGTILFVMDTKPLEANLHALVESDGSSFVIDDTGDIVVSAGQTSLLSSDEFKKNVSKITNQESIMVNSEKYMASSKENLFSGWTFVSLIETNSFYRPLRNVLLLFGGLVVLLILIGMGASVYFATKNYRPIKNLTNAFDFKEGKIEDEFLFLQSNIKRTSSEIELLNSLMNEQVPVIRNAALLRLIEGKHAQGEETIDSLKEAGVHFPFKSYAVAVIELGQESIEAENIINVEKVVQTLNETEPHSQLFHIEATVPYLRNNQIFVIVNLKKECTAVWKKIISFIRTTLSTDGLQEKSLRIGIGNTYPALSKIKNSYIEASSAVEAILSHTNEPLNVLFFQDITAENLSPDYTQSLQYPKEEAMLLVQSMKQGNKRTAVEVIDQFFEGIQPERCKEISTQAVVTDLFNAVLKNLSDIGVQENPKALYELRDFKDVERAKRVLKDITIAICEEVEERLQSQSNEIEKRVVRYVYEYFDSPDISLEEIASESNISISYASKLIKEETGESFSVILQSLRMNKFKELLLTTKVPIKDLVLQVGYYDVSNFTRKFRKENGVTPGEYRKKFHKTQLNSAGTDA